MHARSAGPERRRVGVRSCVRLHPYPTLTPEPHGPMVDHCNGRIPVMHRAFHGSRHVSSRASPRIPDVPVRGVGAGAETGVGDKAGAGGGGTGGRAGVATLGTGVDIGT